MPNNGKLTPADRSTLLSQLGKQTDCALQKIYGLSRQRIYQLRKAAGVPACNATIYVKWTVAMRALLGTAPDKDVAVALHTSKSAVWYARRKFGIVAHKFAKPKPPPPQPKGNYRRWPAHQTRLLGTMPDARLARRLRIRRSLIAAARCRRKIPAYKSNGVKK